MSIRFQCDCGKKLKATDDKIGKRVLCPDCGEPVTVPAKDRLRVETIDAGVNSGDHAQDSAKTAKELLKLSAAASQEVRDADKIAEQQQTRKRGEEATFTAAEAASFYGKQFVLPVVGIVVGFFLLTATAFWMFGDNPVYPDLYPVTGTVKLDGQPLSGAIVTFRSQRAMMDDEKIGPSNGVTNSDGRYTLYYKPDVPGAVLGKHLVEIQKTGPDGVETLPAKFHVLTKIEADVKADKDEGYDFDLKL